MSHLTDHLRHHIVAMRRFCIWVFCFVGVFLGGCEDQWVRGLPVFPDAHQPCESYVPFDQAAQQPFSEVAVYRITPCQGVPHITFSLDQMDSESTKLMELIDQMVVDHPNPVVDVVFVWTHDPASSKKNMQNVAEVLRQLTLKGVSSQHMFLMQKLNADIKQNTLEIYVRPL